MAVRTYRTADNGACQSGMPCVSVPVPGDRVSAPPARSGLQRLCQVTALVEFGQDVAAADELAWFHSFSGQRFSAWIARPSAFFAASITDSDSVGWV